MGDIDRCVKVFDISDFDKWFIAKGDRGSLLHMMDSYDDCKNAFNDWKSGKLEDKDFKEVLNMFFE